MSTQEELVKLIREKGKMSRSDLKEYLGTSIQHASLIFNKLKKLDNTATEYIQGTKERNKQYMIEYIKII